MTTDVLCSFGDNPTLSWKEGQRLCLIGARENPFPQNPRVKFFPLDSPLFVGQIAKQVAWTTVFRTCKWVGETETAAFHEFYKIWEETQRAAELLISDAADLGILALQNAKINLFRPARSALSLAFPGIPAVIVGAGPSLARAKPLLDSLKDKALILAGGNALRALSFPPHFAALVDPKERVTVSPDIPLCVSPRARAPRRDLWLAPDAHFSYLNWIAGLETSFDGGWTVGNFLTALAVRWGCNPIVWIGMDMCYENLRKYATGEKGNKEPLIQATNARGDTVWTQSDWLMAREWTYTLAQNNCNTTFIQMTDTGMAMAPPIQMRPLTERFDWSPIPPPVFDAPILAPPRWAEWKTHLQNQDAVAQQHLLQPLWHIWRPLIERELDLDSTPDKMELNERLFYNRVIQEHLHAL